MNFPQEQLDEPNWFNYSKFYDFVSQQEDFVEFVELGVWLGHSICYLAKKLKERGGRFFLTGIDTWDNGYYRKVAGKFSSKVVCEHQAYEICKQNLKRYGVEDDVCLWLGDSSIRAGAWEDGYVDFVFIDANHSYESVCKDIAAWMPKMRKGGIMAGHDIKRESVSKAVVEHFENYEKNYRDIWWVRL